MTSSTNDPVALAILALFPLCMVFATICDLFTMTIPNRISLVLLAGFVVLAPLAGMGWETIISHILAALLVLSIGIALFSFRVLGGGDAKLIAAAALWFGNSFTLPFLLAAGLLGGLVTLAILALRKSMIPQHEMLKDWFSRMHDGKPAVPYGAALGPAALYIFVGTPWMTFVTSGQPIG